MIYLPDKNGRHAPRYSDKAFVKKERTFSPELLSMWRGLLELGDEWLVDGSHLSAIFPEFYGPRA